MEIIQEYNVDCASQRMLIVKGEIGICKQHCLLWRDRAKSRRNVMSPSQRRVASLWRIATLLLQWGKLVTVNFFYIHPASDTTDANDDLHDTYTEHVNFSFKSK
jgi:hypothetical protein